MSGVVASAAYRFLATEDLEMFGPRGRIQFSIFHLLVAVTVCASLLGYLSSQNRVYDASFYCFRLPCSDDALVDWYEAQGGVEEVRVARKGKEIFVHFELRTSGGTAGRPELPTPPMRELGYGVESIGFGSSSNFGGLVQRLHAVAGTLSITGWGIATLLAVSGTLILRFCGRKASE